MLTLDRKHGSSDTWIAGQEHFYIRNTNNETLFPQLSDQQESAGLVSVCHEGGRGHWTCAHYTEHTRSLDTITCQLSANHVLVTYLHGNSHVPPWQRSLHWTLLTGDVGWGWPIVSRGLFNGACATRANVQSRDWGCGVRVRMRCSRVKVMDQVVVTWSIARVECYHILVLRHREISATSAQISN